jgi:hypothetical protein
MHPLDHKPKNKNKNKNKEERKGTVSAKHTLGSCNVNG